MTNAGDEQARTTIESSARVFKHGRRTCLPAVRADVELGFVNNDGDNFNNITALFSLWIFSSFYLGQESRNYRQSSPFGNLCEMTAPTPY